MVQRDCGMIGLVKGMIMQLKWFWRFLVYLYDRFFDDHCAGRAAALAYATLLSIVPLMLISFYILSFFPALQGSGKQFESFILNNFVASSASVISQHLQTFETRIQVLSLTNLVFLGVVSVLLIYNMVCAANEVWHVKMHRYLALSFVFYVLILLLAPIVFGVLLLFSSYLTTLPVFSRVAQMQFIKQPILYFFPIGIEWLVFTAYNWILPSCRVRLRFACLAGFVTMILFEVAKWGFVQYLTYFPTYQLVYGALATIPIFLVWIYVSWTIVILGCLICQVLQTKAYFRTENH